MIDNLFEKPKKKIQSALHIIGLYAKEIDMVFILKLNKCQAIWEIRNYPIFQE